MKTEGKYSSKKIIGLVALLIIGFCIMIFGVMSMLGSLFPEPNNNNDKATQEKTVVTNPDEGSKDSKTAIENHGSQNDPKEKLDYGPGQSEKTAIESSPSKKEEISSSKGQLEPIRQEVIPVDIKTEAEEYIQEPQAPEPQNFQVQEVKIWAFPGNPRDPNSWYTFRFPNDGKYEAKIHFDGDVEVRNMINEAPVGESDQQGTLGYNKKANQVLRFRSKTEDAQEGTITFWRVS